MSTVLPIVESQDDVISQLLREQQSLSAVERFSLFEHRPRWSHETNTDADEPPDLGDSERLGSDSPAQARYYRDLLPASPPRPGQQYAFEVNLDKCSGCKACVVACHTLNGLEEDEAWRRVGAVVGLEDTGRLQYVTTGCHHCEDPACLRGCPVKAYEKDVKTGIVRHLDDQCIGCKYCTMMCPYEVPKYSKRMGIVRKCDMCHQRLSVGEAPACVQACPNEAIAITVVEKVSVPGGDDGDQMAANRLAPGSPPSTLTNPTTRYLTAAAEIFHAATPQDAGQEYVADNHWPLAVMLITTQVSIGMVLVERIVALSLAGLGGDLQAEVTKWVITIALLIGGAGMGVAPLHLGQPMRAWRIFLGLRTSWLSREAIFLGKYISFLAIATGLLWLPMNSVALRESWWGVEESGLAGGVLAIVVAAGLVGFYSSAQIYIATGRRWWRSRRTLPLFGGTAVVGGLMWSAPVCLVVGEPGLACAATAVGVVFLTLKLLWECYPLLDLRGDTDECDIRSRQLMLGPLWRLTATRFYIGAATVGVAAVETVIASSDYLSMWLFVASGVALLTVCGELLERLLYFSSVAYERMPGTLR